jgi:NADH-quinone oxidoreductase subunit N
MTAADLLPLAPFLLVAATALAVLVGIAIRRSHGVTAAVTIIGLAAALAATGRVARVVPWPVTALLVVDLYALVYVGLILLAALAVAALAAVYLARHGGLREEFYVLLLLATLGAMTLAAATHFASFFLGLELLSISLYALIAYLPGRAISLEAGTKYLVLAGASAAFLAFGMALVYADLGRMDFGGIAAMLGQRGGNAPWAAAGFALIVVGIGFKLAVAPFHLWSPDVYEGAPAPATALVATVSKAGAVALLVRFFAVVGMSGTLWTILAAIAALSMTLGNLLALRQENVKRLLAYSGIAHLGYVLVALLAGGRPGVAATAFYIVVYTPATLAALGVVVVLSNGDRDADRIADLRGLFHSRPLLAATMAAALLSLAGIPLTAGFVGKFYLVAAGVGVSMWTLVVLLCVNSVVGLFYYLRVLAAMIAEPTGERTARPAASLVGGVVLAALLLAILWLGIFPGPVIRVIRAAAGI